MKKDEQQATARSELDSLRKNQTKHRRHDYHMHKGSEFTMQHGEKILAQQRQPELISRSVKINGELNFLYNALKKGEKQRQKLSTGIGEWSLWPCLTLT